MIMRAALSLILPLLAGCFRPTLESELGNLRAEIEDLERSVPPEAPLWIYDGESAFDPFIEDRSSRVPDFIYNHLVRKLAGWKAAEFEREAEGRFDIDDALRRPEAFRGRIWTVSGTVAAMKPLPHRDSRLPDRDAVYQGAVFSGRQPILFHLVEKPDVVYLGSDDVEFTGVFVMLLGYRARDGEDRSAPFFVAKSLRKYY